MTLIEIIGNQHLRILALEETVARLQNENSKLQERVMKSVKSDVELKDFAIEMWSATTDEASSDVGMVDDFTEPIKLLRGFLE